MLSKLQWTAVELHQKMSDLMWRNPVRWNGATGLFESDSTKSKLMPWLFVFYICYVIYGMMGFIYPGLRFFYTGQDRVPVINCMILGGLGGIVLFCWFINLAMLVAGNKSVLVVNRLMSYHIELTKCKKINPS
jgi:hypothetical protein